MPWQGWPGLRRRTRRGCSLRWKPRRCHSAPARGRGDLPRRRRLRRLRLSGRPWRRGPGPGRWAGPRLRRPGHTPPWAPHDPPAQSRVPASPPPPRAASRGPSSSPPPRPLLPLFFLASLFFFLSLFDSDVTRAASSPPARRTACRRNYLWGPAGVGGRGRERRRESRVSSGGGAPAAGTWGRKTRPGTRAAAGAKNNARAPAAPTAARRVPSGPALTDERRHRVPSGPAPARARSTAPEALATTRRRVARGSRLPAPPRPVSPLRAQPRPRAASDGPGPTATYPRPSPPSRASRRPLQAAGTRPGSGRRPRPGQRSQVGPHRQLSVIRSHPHPEGTACTRVAGGLTVLGPWAWPLHLVSSLNPALGTRSLPTQLPLGFLGGADPFYV